MGTRALPTPPPPSSHAVRRVMQGNASPGTRPEVCLRSALHRVGYRFRKHYRPVDGVRCRADIVFSRQRVAVFVDGCFWHSCPVHGTLPSTNRDYWEPKLLGNLERDRRNDRTLMAAGWRVIRIWEHESLDDAVSRVATALRLSD
jgi:DNA mismatch endonuclease (patch repair protein)